MTDPPGDPAAVPPTRTFTQRDMDEFGVASGGTGLIHTEPAYAATTPYGATLVQGVYLLAVIERHLCEHDPRWAEGGELEVGFVAPVTEGTPFTVEIRETTDATGTTDRAEASGRSLTWSVLGTTPSGPAVVGTARVLPG
ncbi:MaoC family dehydratase [Pseudonocardia sp. RS010]|uniref:MaoC family dehydratase n=1 Tax=Pseudonocardia sp. RS010 TaxID=3385979 RepID=UPI0039A05F6C